jgi:hypothetical protein
VDNKGMTVWRMAAEKNKLEFLEKVWLWAKENLPTEEMNKNFLLGTDDNGFIALNLAACFRKLPLLQKLWQFAKENLSNEDLKN